MSKIFISRVSREFGKYSEELVNALESVEIKTRTQPAFRQEPDAKTTLSKLSKYIRQSDIVLCLIGDYSGGFPADKALDRPIFPKPLPNRNESTWRDLMPSGMTRLSYTQWEFVLAQYWGKTFFLYQGLKHQPDTPSPNPKVDDLRQQKKFCHYIFQSTNHDRLSFSDPDKLCRHVLCDLWPEAKKDLDVQRVLDRYNAKIDAVLAEQEKNRRDAKSSNRRLIAISLSSLGILGIGGFLAFNHIRKQSNDSQQRDRVEATAQKKDAKGQSETLETVKGGIENLNDKLDQLIEVREERLPDASNLSQKEPLSELAKQTGQPFTKLKNTLADGFTSKDPLSRAKAFEIAGRNSEANLAYDEIIENGEQAIRRTIQAHQGKGRLASRSSDYKTAIHHFRLALELIDPKIYHLDYADQQQELAITLAKTGSDSEAEGLLKAVLKTRENLMPENDPSIAETLLILGNFYQGNGRLDEARPLLERSLAIYESSFGKVHSKVTASLISIIHCLQQLGHFEESESHLRRVVDYYCSPNGVPPPHVSLYLNNLISFLGTTDRSNEIEPLMKTFNMFNETSFGKNSIAFAQSSEYLAALISLKNDDDSLAEALSLSLHASSIFVTSKKNKEAVVVDKERLAFTLENLGMKYQNRALDYKIRALKLFSTQNSEDTIRIETVKAAEAAEKGEAAFRSLLLFQKTFLWTKNSEIEKSSNQLNQILELKKEMRALRGP